jgi:hypothetical protein
LHPGKTRLIEIGRHAAAGERRGASGGLKRSTSSAARKGGPYRDREIILRSMGSTAARLAHFPQENINCPRSCAQ